MASTKVKTKTVVVFAPIKGGPIKGQIEARGAFTAMFSPAERNAIVRAALVDGGNMWIKVFLPLRFNANYARAYLRYNATQKWIKAKQRLIGKEYAASRRGATLRHGIVQGPQPTPFVFLGEMRDLALRTAKATATATANKQRIIIRAAFGHPIQPATTATFKTVPSTEVLRIARQVGKSLDELLSQGTSSGAGLYGPMKRGEYAMTMRGASSPIPRAIPTISARGV